jgi:hypothetical protein
MLNKEGRNNSKGMKPMYGWQNFIHMAWLREFVTNGKV